MSPTKFTRKHNLICFIKNNGKFRLHMPFNQNNKNCKQYLSFFLSHQLYDASVNNLILLLRINYFTTSKIPCELDYNDIMVYL